MKSQRFKNVVKWFTPVVLILNIIPLNVNSQSFQRVNFTNYETSAGAMSPDGETFLVRVVMESEPRPALWKNGEFKFFNYGGSAITNNGVIVGSHDLGGTPQIFRGHRLENDELTNLYPVSGYTNSAAVDITGDGQIALGQSWNRGDTGKRISTTTVWKDDQIINLGCPTAISSCSGVQISANGNVILVSSEEGGALWKGNEWTILHGFDVRHLSANGNVVIGYYGENAVRWENGTYSTINAPENLTGVPGLMGLSADGSVIITSGRLDDNFNSAFLWTESGVYDIPGLMAKFGVNTAGWYIGSPVGISDDARVIIGVGYAPNTWNTQPLTTWRAVLGPLIEEQIQVNSISDRPNLAGRTTCDTGEMVEIDGENVPECTLRAAFQALNERARTDSISFNINGGGLHTIELGSPLPVPEYPFVLDATTQPGYNNLPLITINGLDNVENGFVLEQGESVVRGFSIGGFTNAGILISGGSENLIEANHIGINAAGTAAFPNRTGLIIDNSSDNQIGGDVEALRNVVSGNQVHGIRVTGTGADGNQIQGNFVGLSAAGTASVGNGEIGILVEGAGGTLIGDASGTAGAAGQGPGNVVSGNGSHGIRIAGSEESAAPGSVITGNLIGLNAAGTHELPNDEIGLEVRGAASETSVRNNVVVGQGGIAIIDLGPGDGAPDGTHVTGNTVGMNATGSAVLGETRIGILVTTTGDAERGIEGVRIGDEGGGNSIVAMVGTWLEGGRSAGTSVISNTIGLLGDGSLAGEGAFGVLATLVDSVRVIGNVVGGQVVGVMLAGDRHEVYGNRLGTDPSGTRARPNDIGLYIPGSFISQGTGYPVGSHVRVGGSGQGNVISGNKVSGMVLGGTFSDPFERAEKPIVSFLASASVIENLPADLASVTSGRVSLAKRGQHAMVLEDDGRPSGNIVAHNLMGTTAAGTGALGNGVADDLDEAGAGLMILGGVGTIVFGNTLSGNGIGLAILNQDLSESFGPEGTLVAGNRIGVAAGSNAPLPNQYLGVGIFASNRNVLLAAPLVEGGEAEANLIMHNSGTGVRVIHEDGLGLANVVRQTPFHENEGPAIEFINRDAPGTLPPGVPDPPEVPIAIRGDDDILLRVRPAVEGELDLFFSDQCRAFAPDGEGDGVPMGEGDYVLSTEPLEDESVLQVPLGELPANPVGLYLSVTATTPGDDGATGAFSACVRIAAADDTAVIEIPDLFVGSLEGAEHTGIDIDITDHGDAAKSQGGNPRGGDGGRLFVVRHHLPPHGSYFIGDATSDDGTTIVPDVVSDTRYWTLSADGLESITYSVCLDITGLPGAEVPGQLVVMQRENIGHPWVPLPSWLADGNTKLCASGLTAFGDLGIGGAGVFVSNEPETPVREEIPSIAALHPNYPNPFNPSTLISFDLPVAGYARVVIYDLMGRSVQTLADGHLSAGRHQVTFDAGRLSSGIYLYRLETAGFTATRKMMMVK